MPVAIVTDSTAMLARGAWRPTRGIVVVPLQVVIGADGATTRARRAPRPTRGGRGAAGVEPVSTSRPTPAALLEAYERLAARGRDRGALAPPVRRDERHLRVRPAGRAGVPDPGAAGRQPSGGRGHRVRRAGRRRRAGRGRDRRGGGRRGRGPGPPRRRRCSTSTPWSTSAAAAGSARPRRCSAVRCRSSRCSRSRTAGSPRWRRCGRPTRALGRLEELAVQAAGERQVDVCVAHLASPDRAGQLAERLAGGWRTTSRPRGLVRRARRRPRRPRRPGHARGLRRPATLTARSPGGRPGAGGSLAAVARPQAAEPEPSSTGGASRSTGRGRRFLASPSCATVPAQTTRKPSPAGWRC